MFAKLLLKAVAEAAKDKRVGTYRAPELATPEYGAAHRQYGSRTYQTFALMHVLDFLNYADSMHRFIDNKSWTTAERHAHLQKVVGKHRRRVR
jgi:hypothetical protein